MHQCTLANGEGGHGDVFRARPLGRGQTQRTAFVNARLGMADACAPPAGWRILG
jgi:hypothetical protein